MEKSRKILLGVLALFLFSSLPLALRHALFWDEAVYIGMGKSIWSLGSVGLWEPARPIVMPLILGLLWKTSLGVLGPILMVLLACGSIYLVHELAGQGKNKVYALVFSILFAINASLLYYSSKIMADIPSMFFSLLSLYLFFRKKPFSSGFFFGISILTKFTSLILLPVFLFKKLRFNFVIGIFSALAPFLVFNIVAYHNPIAQFIYGKDLISSVVGNYTCPSSPLFYLIAIFSTAPILVFSLPGIYFSIRQKNLSGIGISAALITSLVFFSFFLNCKDIRYAFVFLPFLYVLSARAFKKISMRKSFSLALAIIIFLQLAYSGWQAYYTYKDAVSYKPDSHQQYFGYLNGKGITGEVWSSSPMIMVYSDVKLDELVYYPVLDGKKLDELNTKLNGSVQYIFMNLCDIPCVNYDKDCAKRRQDFLNRLDREFLQAYSESDGNCQMVVYEWKK